LKDDSDERIMLEPEPDEDQNESLCPEPLELSLPCDDEEVDSWTSNDGRFLTEVVDKDSFCNDPALYSDSEE